MSITSYKFDSCFVKIPLAPVMSYQEAEVGGRDIREAVVPNGNLNYVFLSLSSTLTKSH